MRLGVEIERGLVDINLNYLTLRWQWARPRLRRWKLSRRAWDIRYRTWDVYTPISVGEVRWWGQR